MLISFWSNSFPFKLHFYLFSWFQPDGKIYPILRDAIAVGAPDMTTLVENPVGIAKQEEMYKELTYIIENSVFHITEIMVREDIFSFI